MEEIEQYLNRAIVDIARKCGVYVEDVIDQLYQILLNYSIIDTVYQNKNAPKRAFLSN